MADQWATEAREHPPGRTNEELATIITIQHLIHEQISPQQAAEKLASTYEACIKCGEGTARMWDLWNIVYDAINNLGDPTSNLQRLVQMMRCISQLPDVVGSDGKVIRSKMNAQVLWHDVPGFAFYFREVAMSESSTSSLSHPPSHIRNIFLLPIILHSLNCPSY